MKQGHTLRILDGSLVRRRRGELGLTESYLGALCGVSGSVIRRLESGWPQEELSTRFIALLAERLGVPLRELVVSEDPSQTPEPTEERRPAAHLGALLATATEPVPVEAICAMTGWSSVELDQAAAELHRALELSGQVLVDIGDALCIASDVCEVTADEATSATKAAYARRRPNLPELRVVHKLIEGTIVRREDLDTIQGMTIQRLRTVGVLAPPQDVNMACDPPELSDDVKYSLILNEL
jgi:transcriptional regulator with XRE-family HTH domain